MFSYHLQLHLLQAYGIPVVIRTPSTHVLYSDQWLPDRDALPSRSRQVSTSYLPD